MGGELGSSRSLETLSQNLAEDEDVIMETREASPSHFLFRIESFSLLEEYGIRKYECGEFVTGDYKWRLVIYPNGDKTVQESDHVSVYLGVANASDLASKWEINAVFSLFLFNQISGKYLATQARTRRFLAMKSKWGFSRFVSKKMLTDPASGYLVDDNCVFGAEVFPITSSQQIMESLSLLRLVPPFTRDWKISDFSKIEDLWTSEEFVIEDYKWRLSLYPKGHAQGAGRFVSIYLRCTSSSDNFSPNQKMMANYSICIRSQNKDQHCSLRSSSWFSSSMTTAGFAEFMLLTDMEDPNKGFLVEDCCIVEIEIAVRAIGCGP